MLDTQPNRRKDRTGGEELSKASVRTFPRSVYTLARYIDSVVAVLMRPLVLLVVAVVCFVLFGGSLLPESEFELAPDSRLPKWFTLADGADC